MSVIILAALLATQDAEPSSQPMPESEAGPAELETVAPPTDAASLIAGIEGRFAAYADTVAELAARKARERYLSELLLPVIARNDLDDGAQGEILRALADTIQDTEAANTVWATQQLDPESFPVLWSENRRLGEDLLRMAERDAATRSRIVAVLEPITLAGEYDGARFAQLADQLAISEDRPQPYATALHCVEGVMTAWPVADSEALDARRAAIGLDPVDPETIGGETCESPAAGSD